MLKRLRESTFEKFVKVGEAAKNKPTYGPDHVPAIRVPVGGSSCLSCKYLGEDKKTCKNKHYILWNSGSNKLLAPPDRFCSDWYKPKEKNGTSNG